MHMMAILFMFRCWLNGQKTDENQSHMLEAMYSNLQLFVLSKHAGCYVGKNDNNVCSVLFLRSMGLVI